MGTRLFLVFFGDLLGREYDEGLIPHPLGLDGVDNDLNVLVHEIGHALVDLSERVRDCSLQVCEGDR